MHPLENWPVVGNDGGPFFSQKYASEHETAAV
jgi:hypothetical protein